MIVIKSQLSDKDKKIVENILYDVCDIYGDFYLTRDNLRLAIRENTQLLYKLLTKGDKMAYDEDGNGMAIIIGFAEKMDRKYLKVLAKDEKIADKLLKNIDWNIPYGLWIKVKKNNPLRIILIKNRYRFIGNRGSEVLLYKEGKIYKPAQEKILSYNKK